MVGLKKTSSRLILLFLRYLADLFVRFGTLSHKLLIKKYRIPGGSPWGNKFFSESSVPKAPVMMVAKVRSEVPSYEPGHVGKLYIPPGVK